MAAEGLLMLSGPRTYRANAIDRKPLVDFMEQALSDAGCTILFSSPPSQAPFVITFETKSGERLGIVAYAFLATRTPTTNRPVDERSFQIKYGSKLAINRHEIWQDPSRLYTTIFVGIDPSEGFFVAADPEMHNPTKFFIRLEFKDRHVETIKSEGWSAWERERRGMDEPVEVLVGGTREHFLDLVRFERTAHGLDQGNRQLLAEHRELFTGLGTSEEHRLLVDTKAAVIHPLARELGLSADEILEVIASARYLKMAVRGWVAETHLVSTLRKTPGVTECDATVGHSTADVMLRYQGGAPLTIQCKNVLRQRSSDGLPRIDFQRTRAAKSDPCSRYYSPKDFDVVAACLHALTERWEFTYARPALLTSHKRCEGKLASSVVVDQKWSADADQVFAQAYSAREHRP